MRRKLNQNWYITETDVRINRQEFSNSYYNYIPYTQKIKLRHGNTKPPQKKAQIKILKVKTTISEMKNKLDGINFRLDLVEENNSKFEDIAMKTVQN